MMPFPDFCERRKLTPDHLRTHSEVLTEKKIRVINGQFRSSRREHLPNSPIFSLAHFHAPIYRGVFNIYHGIYRSSMLLLASIGAIGSQGFGFLVVVCAFRCAVRTWVINTHEGNFFGGFFRSRNFSRASTRFYAINQLIGCEYVTGTRGARQMARHCPPLVGCPNPKKI